jgi:CheY-like chemotaxis protein
VVQGDAIQLQQVLINLCSNACHALPDTGGEIRMRLTLSPASSGERETHCTLQVVDNGCGMTTATLAQVFNPFFTTKEVGKGTGLGLSVVHGIVQDHGGSIDVHSTVGSGSTFDVHLPCRTGPGDATSHRKGETAPATQGRGRTVVFIDDNPLMARLAQRALARAGFRAEIFTAPHEALEWLGTPSHHADAVITDVNMPGMNGISLCRHITQWRPELPVVITSGAVTEELMQQAHQAGARVLIPKEQAFGSLLQAVGAALAIEPVRPDLKS